MKTGYIIFISLTLSFLFTSSATAQESQCQKSPIVNGACFKVVGTLELYNGWPPALRIEPKTKGKLYGIGPKDRELIPNNIAKVLPSKVEGEFEVCPFNETTSVPYDERKIEMVCIQKVRNAWYWDSKTDSKKKLE